MQYLHLIESNSKEVHGVAGEGLPALRDGEAVLGGAAATAHQGGLVKNKFIEKKIKDDEQRKAEQERLEAVKAGQANRKVIADVFRPCWSFHRGK